MTDENRFSQVFLYIILFIQILILIAMFLMIQQINKAVVEIKKFCWGDKLAGGLEDILNESEMPNINIVE